MRRICLLLTLALPLVAAGDEGSSTRQLSPCVKVHKGSRTVESQFGLVRLSIPRSLVFKRGADVDYVQYAIGYKRGATIEWMKLMFGGLVGQPSAEGLTGVVTKREWRCSGTVKGPETIVVDRDGRKSRLVGLVFGLAEYRQVSPDAAAKFDDVLDRMCCGPCPACEGRE